MDENVQLAFLYDTYGELLSKHQRQIFEAVRFDDLSLAEIAEEFDISRQAAHDVYRRTVKKLWDYENVLHLVERDRRVKEKAGEISRIAREGSAQAAPGKSGGTEAADGAGQESFIRIMTLADEISDEL